MKLCLQIAGILQLTLALAHVGFARKLGWREELQHVSLLTRQIFWVHAGFLMLVLAGFGSLSLLHADDLLGSNPLARFVLGGLATFWAVRLYCQFFVYRADHWRGNPFNTKAHIAFGLLWTFLTAVYVTAFLRLV